MTMQVRGATVQAWDRFAPEWLYGVRPPGATSGLPHDPSGNLAGGLVEGPSAAAPGMDKAWHPDSPLFWAGALIAVTLGLIGASTSLRVGPFRAAVSAGKSS